MNLYVSKTLQECVFREGLDEKKRVSAAFSYPVYLCTMYSHIFPFLRGVLIPKSKKIEIFLRKIESDIDWICFSFISCVFLKAACIGLSLKKTPLNV